MTRVTLSAAAIDPPRTATDTFVARQPIVDRQRSVAGYELLFRPAAHSESADAESDRATARVIVHTLVSVGLDTLAAGRRVFVNVGRGALVDGLVDVLPPEQVVLELQRDVVPDDDVLRSCAQLRSAGFALALDDYRPGDLRDALLPLASYVKVDIDAPGGHATPPPAPSGRGPLWVAKRVETHLQFEAAVREGFHLFQGYFLGRPAVTTSREIAASSLRRLDLLRALQDPDLPVGQLEGLIKSDVDLCYRILRAVNSAAFGTHVRVQSIREALVMLGRDRVSRWATVWGLASLNPGAHQEVLATAVLRARCCEALGRIVNGDAGAASAFIVGMCSMLEGILGHPLARILEALPLAPDVRDALQGAESPLRFMLDAATAYERGEWERCRVAIERLGVDESELPTAYLDALQWARELQQG